MICDEKLKEIFSLYAKVTMLSNKNECEVLRIRHKELQKDLVLHRIPQPIPAYEILCGLRHEGLPEIYEVYNLEDGSLILEEYIDGITVEEVSQTGRYNKSGIIKVAKALCLALDVLHNNGIIHRDIKPENIMVDKDGVVKLIDFNASHKMSGKSKDTVIMGTVGYVAPEQLGLAQSDPRTDIYAMGVLLNVMTTGVLPTEKMASGSMGRIIKKCTNLHPGDRYQNAMELYNALSWL